jgi:hypothetical protein
VSHLLRNGTSLYTLSSERPAPPSHTWIRNHDAMIIRYLRRLSNHAGNWSKLETISVSRVWSQFLLSPQHYVNISLTCGCSKQLSINTSQHIFFLINERVVNTRNKLNLRINPHYKLTSLQSLSYLIPLVTKQ